jgi:hypothetical protein
MFRDYMLPPSSGYESQIEAARFFKKPVNIYKYKGCHTTNKQTKKQNSMVRVRERTIPTERPPLVDEVIASFCG